MNQSKITIILPALNEEATIGKVIEEIPKHALEHIGHIVQVLVVDGNSIDKTRQIAEEKGATVIVVPRKGKGIAVRTVLKTIDADFIFMLDADYTYPATYIPDMLNLLARYDVVIGSRLKGQREKGAMRLFNLVGNYLLSLLATFLYQKRVSDVCTGCWGFKAKVVKSLNLRATGFNLEAELFSQLSRKGYSITEIPIYYRQRPSRAKLRAIRDGIRIGWTLITRRFSHYRGCEAADLETDPM